MLSFREFWEDFNGRFETGVYRCKCEVQQGGAAGHDDRGRPERRRLCGPGGVHQDHATDKLVLEDSILTKLF